jgi:hypothetical protein
MARMNKLREWMSRHSGPEQEVLAERAGTSRAYLYRAASGGHAMSIGLAARLERASRGELKRETLVDECARCPFVRGCKR